MKKTSLRQAALRLAIVAIALLAPLGLRAQETLPLYETASDQNQYVPFYGYYGDEVQTNQLIYPASELSDMDGGEITQMVFYVASQSGSNTLCDWVVSIGETSATTLSGIDNTTTLTQVYSGAMTFGASSGATTMTIVFDQPYTYNGGNLLIQFYNPVTNSSAYHRYTFTGIEATGASYCYGDQQDFLPKVTFTYEPAATGGTPKPTGFAVNNILHNQADLSWNENGTATSWQICVNDDEENLITATTNPYTLTGLTPLTAYTVKVRSVGSPNSDWSTARSFSTTAQATVVGDSWSDDFEGGSCGWELVNGTQTNQWVWGTAVNNGGTHALYISNDGGTTYTYTVSGAERVYAQKLLNFETGKYTFSFDWECNGESSNYDYLSVGLLPASATITADNTNSGTLPTGWIAVHNQQYLLGQTTWQTAPEKVVQLTAGNYYLVLRWRQDGSGPTSGTIMPAAVDNVSITRMACPYDVAGLAVDGDPTQTTATITWTAGDATQWQVATKTGDADWAVLPTIYNTNSAALTGLTAATTYQVKARAYCNANDQGTWCDPISLTTACPVYPLDYTCGFEGPNTTGSYQLPLCWTRMGSSTSYPYISSSNYHGGTHSLYFYTYSSTSYRNEIAALPAIDAELNTIRVSFYGKVSSSTSDNNINIGYVTDLNDPETFTLVETVTLTTSHEKYTVSFRNVSDNNGYIAIQSSYSSVTKYIYIDDITVEEIPSCMDPTDLEHISSTTTGATLSWTAGGSETSWDIYYSTENVAPTTQTGTNTSDNPATISGLTASTTYYVWVRAHCGDGDGQQSPWIGGISFATECEAFTVDAEHHYTQDFNGYAAGSTSTSTPATYPDDNLPLCWKFLNRSETSSTYPQVFLSSTSSYAVSGNCLFFKSSSTTPLYAILPEFTSNISDLMLTFTYRNEGTGSSNGTLYVSYMTDPTDASTFNTANAIECDQITTKTEMEVFFPNAPAGSYIAFKYQGGSSNSYYLSIDNVSVEPAPTCRKPSALACDSKTAHTATLSWTNGEVGQTAWQVSYSTDANFDPNSVTPVDVTSNPATIEGLAQSTTYYAYVRANCGGGDYSAWNSTKVTFTTIAGNRTPTGLTVDNSTITSSQATASWTPRDGNTLHESYDIYWALASVEAVPLEPAAPNLIAGITETSQVISGLEAETTYKVWVRDNCGTDGYSNWSSTPCTFMTAAACQMPDDLAASNVTTNSATISWNTYGLTEFNLRYSTDGENWTTVNDVNSPYTFNGTLSSNTAYQVQVQATCNTEAWSSTLNFKTECDAITITNEHHWTENFESPAVTTLYNAIGEMPDCWDNYPTTASSAKILAANANYNYADNSQVLYFYGSGNNYAALPMFSNALNELQITFKYATESNSNGNLTLGYITAEDNGTYNTFTAIGSSYNASQSYYRALTPITVYLNNVPAEATRLVFRWYYTGQYGANVDDIEVSPAPSCYPVGTLADATNIEARSARLSWTLVDNNQDNWDVQYATNDAFSAGVHTNENVAVHTNYTIGNLDPETHYYVRVRANCGGGDYSEWSNTIDFTTDPTCFPVGTLTYDNVGTHSAELSWALVDNGQDHWDVQYATNDAFSEGVQTVENVDVHTDYTLSGLTPETHYWVRVRANCGNVDGYGAWSNAVDFTTGIACPAPTALTLDASTTETLTISWTGSADTWIVAYKEAESLGDFTIATEDATNPYTITGLTDGTLYTVRVRANCGNVNGLSQWLAEDFQTEASCPSPTNLAVTDASETAHGAIITWDGNVDNDSYTVEYAEGPMAGSTTLLDEDFESGSMPTGWTTDGPGTWSIGTGDYSNGTGAGHGTYNAKITHGADNNVTKLITPEIDLSGVTSPTLSYMHIQRSWGGDQDELRVYYRISSSDPWTLLAGQEYTSAVATWTTENNIALPNPSSTYQIAFEMTDGYGYGVGVDNVVVTGEYTPSYTWNELATNATSPYVISTLDPETQYVVRVKGVCGSTPSPASNIVGFTTLEACGAPTAFTLGAVEAHQATFSWTAGIANTAWKVYVKEHGAAEYPVAYTNANTASVTIDGLEANTAYDVKIVPTCNESKILEVENAFTTPCEATVVDIDHPFTESFDVNTFPPSDCWDTIKAGSYGWSRSTSQHHTGDASAYSGYYGDIYLILPDLAIADESADVLLKFWSYNSWTSNYDKNSVVLLEGNNETELWTTAEVSQQWVESTVDLSAYKGQTISIAFKYEGNNAHAWYIDDVTVGFFHTINATASPVAGGTVTGGNTYLHGASVTLTATPNAGYQFVNWTKGGVEQSTNTSYSFTASEDADYVANFANVYTKTITANKWYAISSPVHNSGDDETLAGVTNLTSGTYDLFGFTESAGTWNKPTTVLEQGKGYIYRAAADVTLSFVGTPNSGDISYDLSYACSSDDDIMGFNLVGNPFPQAATPGMACYSLTPAGTWLAQLASYSVPACEAVLVKTNGTGNHVSFNTGGGAKGVSTPALAFTVSGNGYEDIAYAILENGDNLPKIGHLEPNAPELSIPVAGHSYAIATLGAETESFEMTFSGVSGEYTLTAGDLSHVSYCHLIDRVAGKDIDLLSQPSYTFSTSANDAGRFLVKLSASLDNVNGEVAFWNGTSWTVTGEGTLEIYDALGRQLFRHDVNSELRILNSEFPSAGVYVLRLGGNSQKIVVTK